MELPNKTNADDAGLVPFSEIGRRLGVSAQCAQQTCRRALEKLRRNLRKNPQTSRLLRELLREDPETLYGHVVDEFDGNWFPRGIHLWTITPVPRTTRALLYTSRSISDDFKKKRKKGS